ncbi:hypothetical protein SESBI_29580 [Sesbania bispinosa]|nr:hypothetical protein SESBI_29580 [Sesbania bispinosa]
MTENHLGPQRVSKTIDARVNEQEQREETHTHERLSKIIGRRKRKRNGCLCLASKTTNTQVRAIPSGRYNQRHRTRHVADMHITIGLIEEEYPKV